MENSGTLIGYEEGKENVVFVVEAGSHFVSSSGGS